MRFQLIGVNHKTAPVEVRERLAIPESRLPEACKRLSEHPAVAEGMIVSTCNRVEFIANMKNGNGDLREFLREYFETDLNQLETHLYEFREDEAVRHIFRVAASLDSMVVGESQILGQVKEAYALSLIHIYLWNASDWRTAGRSTAGCRVEAGRNAGRSTASLLQQRSQRSIKNLLWTQLFKFFLNATPGRLAHELRRAKLTGRKIQGRKAHAIFDRRHSRQKVVLLRVQGRIRRRPRGDYARHFAPHQLRCEARVFYLLSLIHI